MQLFLDEWGTILVRDGEGASEGSEHVRGNMPPFIVCFPMSPCFVVV